MTNLMPTKIHTATGIRDVETTSFRRQESSGTEWNYAEGIEFEHAALRYKELDWLTHVDGGSDTKQDVLSRQSIPQLAASQSARFVGQVILIVQPNVATNSRLSPISFPWGRLVLSANASAFGVFGESDDFPSRANKGLSGINKWVIHTTPQENPEAGTGFESYLPGPIPIELEMALERAFFEARDEVFEDGIASVFSQALVGLIKRHGNIAVFGVDQILLKRKINMEVAAEALLQLGLIEHEYSRDERTTVLLKNLRSPSVQMRDAASLGLAALDDPMAIPELRMAIKRENLQLMKRNLELTLSQLENTRQWASF